MDHSTNHGGRFVLIKIMVKLISPIISHQFLYWSEMADKCLKLIYCYSFKQKKATNVVGKNLNDVTPDTVYPKSE